MEDKRKCDRAEERRCDSLTYMPGGVEVRNRLLSSSSQSCDSLHRHHGGILEQWVPSSPSESPLTELNLVRHVRGPIVKSRPWVTTQLVPLNANNRSNLFFHMFRHPSVHRLEGPGVQVGVYTTLDPEDEVSKKVCLQARVP